MPKEGVLRIGSMQFRADTSVSTFDEESRSVDVTFATDTPVSRRDWDGERYEEVLSMSPKSIRMDRFKTGASLLDSHRSVGIGSVLGVTSNPRIEDGKAIVTVRFANTEEGNKAMGMVKDGILRNVSVGYNIHAVEKRNAETGKATRFTATDWEPMEVSLVPIPADSNANIRSNENEVQEVPIINFTRSIQNAHTMTPEEIEVKRLADEATANLNAEKIRKDAIALERTRVSEISTAVRAAKLDETFKDKLISDGTELDKARAAIIEELGKKSTTENTGHRIQVGTDTVEKRASGIEEAIFVRANPDVATKEQKESFMKSEFRGMSLIDMARKCIEENGGNTTGLTKEEIAKRAFGADSTRTSGGANSISDYPVILGNLMNRTLRQMYELQPRTFQEFSRQSSFKDFRPVYRVQLGDVGTFQTVLEGGEYQRTTMSEYKESYAPTKSGIIMPLTWEAMVQDDLDAFSRIPMSIAQKAAQLQSDLVYAILTGNPNMADGNALFSSAHSNVAAANAAIGVQSLSDTRKLLRKQKSPGNNFLNIEPKYLLVAPELEQQADQYTSSNFSPLQSSTINPSYNTRLTPIIENRLSALNNGLSWFMMASPGSIDTIEYSFLEGNGELFTEQRLGFDVDGLELKARMVFGCKAIDWRGMAKNIGA